MGPLTCAGPPRVSPDPSWTSHCVLDPSQTSPRVLDPSRISPRVLRPVPDLPEGPPTLPGPPRWSPDPVPYLSEGPLTRPGPSGGSPNQSWTSPRFPQPIQDISKCL